MNSFRKNWAVNEYGKWSESNYQAAVYPPFPCGATYILSSYLVNWLSLNSKSLFRYQGEDVSMGIWLASILPDYEHVSSRFLLLSNIYYVLLIFCLSLFHSQKLGFQVDL